MAHFELEYDCMHLHQNRPASSGQWLRRHDLLNFITTLYEGDLHAKRVLSLANATLGVLTSASLAIPCSGARLGPGHGHVDQAWCEAGGSAAEQSRPQRLGLFRVLDAVHRRRPHRGGRRAGLDELCGDGQDTIVLSMVTGHGRATPLLWKTVGSSTLKGNQQVSGSSPLAGSRFTPYRSVIYEHTAGSASVASACVGCT